MACRFCQGQTAPLGKANVLGRFEAQYLRCTSCESVQVDSPSWLDEAYADPLAKSDLGQVSRAVTVGAQVSALLRFAAPREAPCLDYSGGTGLFVRMMRDRGYDFWWCDPLAENIFATGFEAALQGRFELITALEVVEHLVDPIDTLERLAGHTDTIVLSTYLVPSPTPMPHEWWYYATDTGQHVSFISRAGLDRVARRLGLHLHSRASLHVLTRRSLPKAAVGLALRPRCALGAFAFTKRDTLLPHDYEAHLQTHRREVTVGDGST
jgi:hypothetical protein